MSKKNVGLRVKRPTPMSYFSRNHKMTLLLLDYKAKKTSKKMEIKTKEKKEYKYAVIRLQYCSILVCFHIIATKLLQTD